MELTSARFAETLVLSPVGRIDHASAEAFKDALLARLTTCAAGKDSVVIDLSRVEYIASAGLRGLMLGARQAKAQGGILVVAALPPVVQEVFEISRFTLVFKTFTTVRDAVATIAPNALASLETTDRAAHT